MPFDLYSILAGMIHRKVLCVLFQIYDLSDSNYPNGDAFAFGSNHVNDNVH